MIIVVDTDEHTAEVIFTYDEWAEVVEESTRRECLIVDVVRRIIREGYSPVLHPE